MAAKASHLRLEPAGSGGPVSAVLPCDLICRLAVLMVFCRIDYQIATADIAAAAKSAAIYKATRFSDHAPLIIDYDVDL